MAQVAVREGFHEWGCYCSQQSAEKALKALAQLWNPGMHRNIHTSDEIIKLLPFRLGNPQAKAAARNLDPFAERTRYPVPENRHKAPLRVYSRQQADDAIRDAQEVLKYAERLMQAVEQQIQGALTAAENIR